VRRPMSTLRRTLLGGLVGTVAGPVVFFCFAILGAVICDPRAGQPGVAELAAHVSVVLGPVVGGIGGAAWAFGSARRGKPAQGPTSRGA